MTHRDGRLAVAVSGGAAVVFAIALSLVGGQVGAGEQPNGNDGRGAIPVQPVGGGACIIGLNCGCIPHRTCPTPHAHPGTAGANQHNAPAPQNP